MPRRESRKPVVDRVKAARIRRFREHFAAILRSLREGAGLGVAALAEKAGIDHSQLVRLESAERSCTLETAVKIASALGVPLECLTSGPTAETCTAQLRSLREMIRAMPERQDLPDVLSTLTALREQLLDCVRAADAEIARASEQLELADLLTPDTDPIRRVAGARARRLPEDGPLLCDPDDPSAE